MLEDAQKLREDIDTFYERPYLALQKANITVGKIEEIAQRIPLDHQINIKIRSLMGIEIPKVTTETNTQMFRMAKAIQTSRKRTNALKSIVITKFETTIK